MRESLSLLFTVFFQTVYVGKRSQFFLGVMPHTSATLFDNKAEGFGDTYTVPFNKKNLYNKKIMLQGTTSIGSHGGVGNPLYIFPREGDY